MERWLASRCTTAVPGSRSASRAMRAWDQRRSRNPDWPGSGHPRRRGRVPSPSHRPGGRRHWAGFTSLRFVHVEVTGTPTLHAGARASSLSRATGALKRSRGRRDRGVPRWPFCSSYAANASATCEAGGLVRHVAPRGAPLPCRSRGREQAGLGPVRSRPATPATVQLRSTPAASLRTERTRRAGCSSRPGARFP